MQELKALLSSLKLKGDDVLPTLKSHLIAELVEWEGRIEVIVKPQSAN